MIYALTKVFDKHPWVRNIDKNIENIYIVEDKKLGTFFLKSELKSLKKERQPN